MAINEGLMNMSREEATAFTIATVNNICKENGVNVPILTKENFKSTIGIVADTFVSEGFKIEMEANKHGK